MKAFCCECKKYLNCNIVKGDIIYPHRPDLYDLEYIQCPVCKNYTGKYEGEKPTLPTKHIRSCRYSAHRALDKIWKDQKKRSEYYGYMSKKFDRDFHWGEIKTDEDADEALRITLEFLEDKLVQLGGEE